MIVRIYSAKTYPGAWPSIEQKYSELNTIATPGFPGRLVTQDVNDPESLYTITFWEDLASVRDWESSDEFEKVFVAAIRPYVIGSSSVSLCEVKVEGLRVCWPWQAATRNRESGLHAFTDRASIGSWLPA